MSCRLFICDPLEGPAGYFCWWRLLRVPFRDPRDVKTKQEKFSLPRFYFPLLLCPCLRFQEPACVIFFSPFPGSSHRRFSVVQVALSTSQNTAFHIGLTPPWSLWSSEGKHKSQDCSFGYWAAARQEPITVAFLKGKRFYFFSFPHLFSPPPPP